MSEKTKEEQLKEKLVEFFDKRLSDLNTKFTSDIEKIESYKYDYFDSVIKIYREIQQEQEEFEKLEKEKEKEKHEKKVEEPKHDKLAKKKPVNTNKERPKTPSGIHKPKPKGDKDKEKHDNTTHETKEKKKPTLNTINIGNTKPSKTGRINTESNKRPYTSKPDNKKNTTGKKSQFNNKKTDNKKGKGKKDTKNPKDESKEQKEEIKEEPKLEEKKPVIINPKYIINIPDEIKNKNNLCSIYFIIKKNYLNEKNIFIIAKSNPLIYKCFGNNIKFLLDSKKNDVDKKAKEIEAFLNNYGDLNNYLNKEFVLSKKAMNSLSMFKKEEISKSDNLPSEMGNILKYLYYLLDEKFEETMSIKELLDNMLTNILEKIEDKTFKSLLVNYFQKNKFLNLTKEKADNINKIVNENNTILNMAVIAKTCRPFNFISFLFKEVHDYINLKTSDGHYYYELRQKNQQLQKYLDFIYLYDNNGKERNKPTEEKPKEEENKNETEEKAEKTEEETKKEEKPEENKVEEEKKEDKKEENKVEEKKEEIKPEEEKKEEIKPEENKVEEESVKKEESTEPEKNA